jgi:death-on-curing protein
VSDPVWVLRDIVLALHEAQLAEHGGPAGVRDGGLLASALGRPRHLHAYGQCDIFDLAAAYAGGIVRNHPFVDGNKRTAFVTTYVFLRLNGYRLIADQFSAATAMLTLASGDSSETAFASWLRAHCVVATE